MTADATGANTGTNAEVVIAPMRAVHINALMPYERAMFGTEAWTVSGYQNELADGEHRYYIVAEHDLDLLGWAGIMIVADTAEILTVGVIPAARRRGVARALVAELIAEARRREAGQAFLEVRVDNAAARALYLRAGFAEVGMRPGYYDSGRVDAVVMRLEL
ncbi:MAG: ribosomal protein S18-alanine N-acetyltransferase [Actinomycetota bacterium]|nr:ribosomal protein S18-alanine N-acetyltransferase [Actinomycetota bacterium]